MADQDLELGQLGSFHNQLSSLRHISGFDFIDSLGDVENKSTVRPIEERAGERDNLAQDDSIIEVPRQQLEQLMKLWIEIFQKSLGGRHLRPEQSTSAGLPTVQELQPTHTNDRESMQSSRIEEVHTNYSSWRDTVEVMSESKIEVENECRRSIRKGWRPDNRYAYLEDSWKHLWEPVPGSEGGLFQFSHPEEKRKALQLDLIDALNAQSDIVIVNQNCKDFRSIAPWISLIGLRLNGMRPIYKSSPGINSVKQIEVLIECLWCCNKFSPKLGIPQNRQGPTVGEVLSACYRRRVLDQPKIEVYSVDNYLLREHFHLVRIALYLISTLYKHSAPLYNRLESLDAAWRMLLFDVEFSMRHPPRKTEVESRQAAFCRIADFDVRDLQNLGYLQIQWTSYWDEHLELEISPNGNVLKLYWFKPTLAQFLVQNRLCTKIRFGERKQRENEILATWSILFKSKSEKKSHRKYGRLKSPKWMNLLAHSKLGTWDSQAQYPDELECEPELSSFFEKSTPSQFCLEIDEHLARRWPNLGEIRHDRVFYSHFPIYGDRLRELRGYMDSQDPQGLRALWRDRRNSNTYYTFWFVAIFGSLSVLLATCALAVSIAQTWAAFHPQSQPSPPTS